MNLVHSPHHQVVSTATLAVAPGASHPAPAATLPAQAATRPVLHPADTTRPVAAGITLLVRVTPTRVSRPVKT